MREGSTSGLHSHEGVGLASLWACRPKAGAEPRDGHSWGGGVSMALSLSLELVLQKEVWCLQPFVPSVSSLFIHLQLLLWVLLPGFPW